MILSFTLSMPNNNAWNGKWTGEDRLYVRVKNLGKTKKAMAHAKEMIDEGYYYYNFGDGWGAAVTVQEVDAKEARRLRAKSQGFCGYDWMIDSIMSHGKIYASHEEIPAEVS